MDGREPDMNGFHQPAVNQDRMQVFVGTLVHATRDQPLLILPRRLLGLRGSKIIFVEDMSKLEELQSEHGFPDSSITSLTSSQFLMPGLVDTHIHAPQFVNNGLKLDLPLLQWLQKYTFPAEATFAQESVARDVYPRVVDRLLKNGTTTACYFASLHLEATKILADTVVDRGQRALVGKVNMLRNAPEYYRESSLQQSLVDTEEFIMYVQKLKSPLVQPIVTPRFAITCDEAALQGLAQLAAKYDCHIQSHMAENKEEVAFVSELFPASESFGHVYEAAGILGHKTIMAHCCRLEPGDLERLAKHGVGVAHCPNSNLSIRSGLCDVRRLLQAGVKVGLGTDCSGGYSPSLLDAIRRAVHVSNTLNIEDPAHQNLSLAEVFRLATLGGAQLVNMEDRLGNFEVGKEFDALLIDCCAPDSPLDIFEQDQMEEQFEKFMYNGDDRNIMKVYVGGKCVVSRYK